eukprot:gene10057-8209_t
MSNEEQRSFFPEWVSRARETGTKLDLYDSSGSIVKENDDKLPVIHKFMAKFLEEDEKGDISLIGTIIQQVAGMNKTSTNLATGEPTSETYKFDKFRLNDLTAKIPDEIDMRRSVPVPGFGSRTTYNCNVPMQKEPVFTVPPYEIFRATALVELTTSSKETVKDGKSITTNIRPDVYVNPEDERELFIIRKKDELNNTNSYNLVSKAAQLE